MIITASELLHGVHRADEPHRAKREAFVAATLRNTPALAFDLDCARQHSLLWARLESEGVRIGPHDMSIAATCLAFGHRLATLHEREFARVQNLSLANTSPYITTP